MKIITCQIIANGDKTIKIQSNRYGNNSEYSYSLDLSVEDDGLPKIDIAKRIFSFVDDLTTITSLELTMCFLIKLPDCLTVLPLKELDISHNFFSDTPNCLKIGLANLKTLNLSTNDFKDFPEPIMCLKKVCDLNISNNLLSYLPKWLNHSDCPNIIYLNISFNNFINVVGLETLRKLERLCIKNCNLTNLRILYQFNSLKVLEAGNEIDQHLNAINDIKFSKFMPTETLLELDLSKLGLSTLSNDINKLILLQKLILNDNFLSTLPGNIAKLKYLKLLNISNNEIIELPDLQDLNNLTELYISNNLLSSTESLLKLKALKILDLYANYLTEPIFDLFDNQNLVALDLEQNCFDKIEEHLDVKKYCDLKKSLRNIVYGPRKDGQRVLSEDSDKSDFNESDFDENEVDIKVENLPEENWDDCDVDDELFLLPCQLLPRIKPYRRKLWPLLDDSYYADSPDDMT